MYQYQAIIIDALNLAYKVFPKSEEKLLMRLNSKSVQIDSINQYIKEIDFLEKKFLDPEGNVFLLFDNPTSRDELKSLFVPLGSQSNRKSVDKEYKANRTANTPQFYASVDFIKYYYMINDSHYKTVRITNLEADDLVKPCLNYVEKLFGEGAKSLLVTDDSDWCRYLSNKVHYLPDLFKEPKTGEVFLLEKGFPPTEEKIILEKILCGDKADNVKAVFPEIPLALKYMAIKEFDSIVDFLYKGPDKDYLEEWKEILIDRRKEAQAAYQMLATIPVSEEQFKYNCVIGRNAKALLESFKKTVNKAFPTKDTFEFGAMKLPRLNPKDKK